MRQIRTSIRPYMLFLTLMPLLLTSVSLAVLFLHHEFTALDEALLVRGQLIARQLAASSEYGVFSHNRSVLQGLAKAVLSEPDVTRVEVLSQHEILIALGGDSHALSNANVKMSGASVVHDTDSRLILMQPILSTQVAMDEFGVEPMVQQIGAVVIEMSRQNTYRQKANLLLTTIIVSMLFLCLTLWLVYRASRRIIDPIQKLQDGIAEIGAGDLTRRITQESGIRELCGLSEGINQMAEKLQVECDSLQQRIDEATAQLRNLAFYDALTLLPNRRLLTDRLAQAFAASKRTGCYGAVLFLDLDNFKPLNDQHGHAVGDLLLIEVARRIGSCLREEDSVARFGGDEFVVMLGELAEDEVISQHEAQVVAEKIRSVLAEPYRLVEQHQEGGEKVLVHRCAASIGVALFANHSATQDEVIGFADAAMYQAKAQGRNQIYFYHPSPLRCG